MFSVEPTRGPSFRITAGAIRQDFAAVAIALLSVAALGCGGHPRAPRPSLTTAIADAGVALDGAASSEPAHASRPVRIALDAEPNHLNPDLDPDRWGYRIAYDAIYEPLVRRGPSGIEPVLADRWSVDGDHRCYTFHLRPGIKFQDDHPVTVVDVAFTFDRLREKRTYAPRVQAELADLERVELAGKDTVRLWAARPSAYLLDAIADVAILPEHVFGRGELMYQPANRRPVGSGPFRLRSWERGRKLVLERWPGYWGAPAHAKEIDFLLDQDAARTLGAIKRGDVDVMARVPTAYLPEQLDSPSIHEGYETVRTRPARFAFVAWNLAHAPLDDAAVRRALSLAIDRARLVKDVRHGAGRAIAAPPALGIEELPVPPGDLAAAQAALDAAGITRKGEGPRMMGGTRPWHMTLLVPSGSRESEETAKRLAETLGKLGITVETVAGELPPITMRLKKGMFDAVLLEWSGRVDDDLAPLFRTNGAQNFGGYSSHAVDLLVDALRRPAPDDERRTLARRLEAALAEDAPALFLYAPEEVMLYARRLGEVPELGDFLLLRDVGR